MSCDKSKVAFRGANRFEYPRRPRLSTSVVLLVLLLLPPSGCGGRHSGGEKHETHELEAKERLDQDGEKNKEGDERGEVKLSPEAVLRYNIQVAMVEKQVLGKSFSAPARVTYNLEAMAHVDSAVSGRVAEVKVRLGDAVKQGDVLLLVESPEFSDAQSAYRSSRASSLAARNAYERARKLLEETQGIALGEVQKREVELKMAEAATSAAESKLRLFGFSPARIEAVSKTGVVETRYSVTAPLSAVVIARNVTLGELVDAERESLLILADMSTVWVLADLPEVRLKDTASGFGARVKVPALPDEVFEGTVTVISPSLEPTTRTAAARIEVKDPRSLLRPGMFAQAEIVSRREMGREELSIPASALQRFKDGLAVFVPAEGEECTFVKRPVNVGPAVDELVPVLSGLIEGERVVVSGSFILKAELGKAELEED